MSGPIICRHPRCDALLRRGRLLCGRHWFALPDDMRKRYARGREVEVRGSVVIEIDQYFQSRLLGPHEIVRCKGKECGEDIVWLTTINGKQAPVDAASVSETDELFDPKRHIAHFGTCKNTNDFRRTAG